MEKQSRVKTNVMRILEQAHVAYTPHEYPHAGGAVDGVSVATSLGQNPEAVFKTLVTRGKSGAYHVFCVPVAAELDLKKAAKAAGEKATEMTHVKELLGLTGYVRGGCSPIGMKKLYPVTLHETALGQQTIFVSAGKIGYQVELAPQALMTLIGAQTADITV